jgi:pre-mRNA branch site protein p14
MDAKQACDKLNGFNFQNRYLVGMFFFRIQLSPNARTRAAPPPPNHRLTHRALVLYHQPEKMVRSKEDLEARKENLERLKKQHGID